MPKTASFKRLILRAVLRQVSPMVIHLVSVSDHMPRPEFHDVFRTILGWNGDLGYISCARSGVQQLPAEDAVESTARVQAAPAGKVPLRLRHPAYVGVGRSLLGYSGGGRRRPRAGLCGRPRRCAPRSFAEVQPATV